MNEILDRYRKADPLLSPISPDDILKIQRALNKYITHCKICSTKASSDYICMRIAANNMIRSLPMINKNIYPWRNYDWDYANFIEKNYYPNSTGATNRAGGGAAILRNVDAINKLIDGYLTDPIPNKYSKAGGGLNALLRSEQRANVGWRTAARAAIGNKYSDEKDCKFGSKTDVRSARQRQEDNAICLERNNMMNLTPNEIPSSDDFLKKKKLDGIYSSSYYVKIGSCPRHDIPTKTECNNNKYTWTPNTTGKIISTLSGCKDGCGCIRNKNTTCSGITKKGACIGSCKWDETDITNPKCITAPESCDGWNRVDCKGKCNWDTVHNKCINKPQELKVETGSTSGTVTEPVVSCASHEKDKCENICEWSEKEDVCKKKNMKCNSINNYKECVGTCQWTGSNCIDKRLICSDRTQQSCKGGCEWKYLTRDNDGSCGQPRYMFIDNSSKPFVNGSKGMGILPSMANDLVALSPDKLFAAATGNSVRGSFEQQQCPTIIEFSFKTALGGFTRTTFTIPAQDVYKDKWSEILTIRKNGKLIKPGIQLVQIYNESTSIWLTVVVSVINSLAKDMNTKLSNLSTYLNKLPPGISACSSSAATPVPTTTSSTPASTAATPTATSEYVSEPCKITEFKKFLKEKFKEKKIYYNEINFDNLDINKFTAKPTCTNKCSTLENFTNLSENSKVYIQINKIVLISITLLIFILIFYVSRYK